MVAVTLRLTPTGTVVIRAKGIRVHCSRIAVLELWARQSPDMDKIISMSRAAGLQLPPQDFDDIGDGLQM